MSESIQSTPNHPGSVPELSEVQRCELSAYNAAFEQLGFSWRWTESDYRALLALSDARARVEHYLREHHPHLLRAYDCGALVALIDELKCGCAAGRVSNDARQQSFDPEFRPL